MNLYSLVNSYKNIGVNSSPEANSRKEGLFGIVDTVSEYQYGLERLESSNSGFSNPKFMLTSPLNSQTNKLIEGPNKNIVRGYIRRSDIDPSDPTSRYRLYFMFNPEQIERNYMAYLDQQALDPYNNLFGSNNMSAPPGILDFTFDLLFDRQLEVAGDARHPGTKVDYDYFDIVVRGVIPDINNNGSSIPDNGVMMVNPRNIAVIFSRDLAVHGRPYNSYVRFEKFSHRMTPTRMVVSITMKAFYVGPVQTVPNFNQFTSEEIFSATIPYDEKITYEATFTDVEQASLIDQGETTTSSSFPSPYTPTYRTYVAPTEALFQTKGVILNEDQMADLVIGYGLRGEAAAIAISIAYRESRFNSGAYNPVNLDRSVGLFQFNMHPGAYGNRLGTMDQLMVPAYSMEKFIQESRNGTYFKPWYLTPEGMPTVKGYELKFLPRARQLVQARGAY